MSAQRTPKSAKTPATGKTAKTAQPAKPPKMTARQRAEAEAQAAQRRRDRRILALVAIGVVLLLLAGGIGFQAWRSAREPSAGRAAPGTETPAQLRNGEPVVFGSSEAPVDVSLYSDFHCPHCADFEESYGPVLDDVQARGLARQRIYPMSFIDAGSVSAANAFGCAAQQGFGQSYFNGLFANPKLDWNDDQLTSLAEKINGSVPDGFADCVGNRSNAGWVDSINTASDTAGVSTTPTVFVDQTMIDLTAVTPDALRTMIEEAAQR